MGWISDQSHSFLFVITDKSLQYFSLKLECVCKLSLSLSLSQKHRWRWR